MTGAKVVRFAAVLVALAGYLFAFRSGESRIAARAAQNALLVDRLTASRRLLDTSAALESERTRLREQLATTTSPASRDAAVSHFIREAASSASTLHTKITTITASSPPVAPVSAASAGRASADSGPREVPESVATALLAAATNPFHTTAFDVILEGRYGDVLATVRALSGSANVLTSVDISSVARKSAATADPAVTASLRVVLHHTGARDLMTQAAGVHGGSV